VSTDRPATVLRIAGSPTPEETAAVVAVLSALGAGSGEPAGPAASGRRGLWNARSRAARPRLTPGPGAWKGSALPR
jgi:hypothetical protein